MKTLRLDGEFPTVTRDEWLQSVEKVLKGADFKKVLVSKTYDGIAIQPLYKRAEDASPEGRCAGAAPWLVHQRIDHTDVAAANAQIREDREGGAEGFVIVGHKAPSARGFGLRLEKEDDANALFKGVDTSHLDLRIDAGSRALHAAQLICKLAEQKKIAASHLSLDMGCDPIGALVCRGHADEAPEQVLHACADIINSSAVHNITTRAFLADGRPYHEAGASEAQELAAVLSTALFYFRYLVNLGTDIAKARDALSFLLVADADEFMTVAKFRALRRLWRKVELSCGLEPKPIRIHAETAWRMLTRYDPWTNLLRETTATFSAGIGGADTISVLPFTNALGLPDAVARRTARNIQLVLINESNLWRVVDPAAGAGGFETLTDELCNKVWGLFQQIEREGGIASSLEQNLLQARIAETRQQRQKDIVTKKLPVTGISEFPNIHGDPVSVLAPLPPKPGENSGKHTITIQPLASQRDAEVFEKLRDRVESHAAASGKRERVFIVTFGSPAQYSGRATYARNYFEVAGLEAVLPDKPLTAETLKNAYAASGARIACLASSDEGYLEGGKAISKALADTDCRLAFIACRTIDPAWELAGGIVAAAPRGNALAILEQAVNAVLPASSSPATDA